MNRQSALIITRSGAWREVTTTYEEDELFYEIDGETYRCIETKEVFVDGALESKDVILKQVVKPRHTTAKAAV